jgi:predicted amidohydrolase
MDHWTGDQTAVNTGIPFPDLFRIALVVLSIIPTGPVVRTELLQAQTPDPINIAVAQIEIKEELFLTVDAFTEMIRDVVDVSLAEGADLVVFPEYTNVFLPAARYHREIKRSDTVAGALKRIRGRAGVDGSTRDLLVEASPWIRSIMDRVYGDLARRHNLHILAGTYFAARSGRLTNRSVAYGPDGDAVWEQDKVFLTDFERRVLGLDEGRLQRVESFIVDGYEVGVTICRDLFFPVWEDLHRDRDIWIDLRAEGSQWEQGREDFVQVLPDRMIRTDADYGVTAALTGEFLDLYWEGKSVVFERTTRGKVSTIAVARSPRRQEVIIVTLEYQN